MKDIKNRLLTKPLASVYLIYGTDEFRQQEIYNTLRARAVGNEASEWNWISLEADNNLELGQIITELNRASWDGRTKIIAITNAHQLPSQLLERLVNWLESNGNENCLALFFRRLDRRLKTVKKLMGLSFEINCESPQGEALIRWVDDHLSLQNKKIGRQVVINFLDRTGTDLNFIKNELDKLIAYTSDREIITQLDVDTVTSLAPGQLEKGAIFNMTQAIAMKNTHLALDILSQLLDAKEPALRILPLIDRQLRLLLAAKSLGNLSTFAVAKEMGESKDFGLRQASKYQNNFSTQELYYGLNEIINTDRELKFGADPRQTLEHLIIKLCELSA